MSTSANVVEYRIEKDGKTVGNYRQNLMCMSRFEEMLKYQPLEEHTVTPYGYDEEEDYWEDDTQNLKEYLQKHIRTNKVIREYFESK
jgi:hypothetical protein